MKSTFARRISILLVLAMVLAMLPVAAFAADAPTTLYLQPSSTWLTDSPRFAAYFFGNGETWVDMTDADADGVYEVAVPEGYPSVIFCRMNPNAAANNWTNKWNQTADLTIPTDGTNCYAVTPGTWDKGGGTWSTFTAGDEVTEATTVPKNYSYYVAGTFTDWSECNDDYGMTLVDGVYTLELTLPAGTHQFKVTDGTWTNSWGLNGTSSNYEFVLTEESNVTITFDTATKIPAVESSAMGEVTVYDYYLVGDMNGWSVSSTSGMTANGDGTYSVTIDLVADTYEYKVNNGTWDVCFPAGTDNASVVVTADCAVTFTLNPTTGELTATGEGVESGEIVPPIPEGNYYVAGSMNEWTAGDADYIMTANGDGTYSYTFTAMAVGTYSLKVTAETWDQNWTAAEGSEYLAADGNLSFTVTAACDVVVTFDGTSVSVAGENVTAKAPEELVVDKVVIAGGVTGDNTADPGNMFNSQIWAVGEDITVNKLYDNNDGVYSITFSQVLAGSYDFKFVVNDDWSINYASGLAIESGVECDAWFNAMGNSTVVVTEDGSTVTFVLDLSGVTYVGDNAKMTVTVEAPASIKENVAPEQIVIGDNEFAVATGNITAVTAPYTATYTGTLYFYPTAMTVVNWMGELEEVPSESINMQFGRMYGIVVDGVTVWGNSIEVVEGQTYQIGIIDNMGGGCEVTLTVCSGHNFVDSTCSVCGYVCSNHNWDNGTCLICGETCAHENWDGGWCTGCWLSCEHSWTYTYTKGVSHSFTCSGLCGQTITIEDTDSKQFKINSAAPVLGEDIALNYRVTLPAGFTDAYMVFEQNGETHYVWESTLNSNGLYSFICPGINPLTIGDNVCATLYAYVEGVEVSVQIAEYSVLKYCDNQLKKTTITETLRTILSDVLVYGAKAQVYSNYLDNGLVTDRVTDPASLTPSTFTALDASYNLQQVIGTKNADIDYRNVSLVLGSKVKIRLGVTCTDLTADYTFKVTVAGEEYTYTTADLVAEDAANGKYYLDFDKLRAVQLGELVTATIWNGETQVGRTVEYSVYTYVQKNQTSSNTAMVELLEAIYNYGESAKNA